MSANLALPPGRMSRPPAPALPLRHLLETFTSTHPLRSPSPLPPSSRVDPKLTQRLAPSATFNAFTWTITTWLIFLRFLALKGFHIIWSLVCHFLFGPKRRSWGYRMTFITSFMRNIADHSSLADIVMIRRLISLHFLLPLPADAVVTPITFTVPLRKGVELARGFLRELDSKESGTRELTGEWVVGTNVWKRLKAERRARQRKRRNSPSVNRPAASTLVNDLTATTSDVEVDTEPSNVETPPAPERVIYYVHGGAYYVGNAATHRLVTIGVSKACNARVFAITYRLAPEHAFPLPLHDVLSGYLRLLAPPLSIPPENIIIAGDSAGGGLSLALCMYLRDEGYKLPAGLVLMSPWVDLTMSCGSWDENADSDVVPRPEADDHLNPVGCYLGPQGIVKYLTHPYASPLFGNFHGLPPMLIQSGDSEVLRDENTLLAHKATLAGVHVTHELYEDMVHVFQMFSFVAAAGVAINNVGRWVRTTLPLIEEEVRASEGRFEKAGMLGLEVEDEVEGQGQARIVGEDGEEVGVPRGQSQAIPDEVDAVRDQREWEEVKRGIRTPSRSSSPCDCQNREVELQTDGPTVDLDSLPIAESDKYTDTDRDGNGQDDDGDSSGSITPTDSRSRTPQSGPIPLPGSLGLDIPARRQSVSSTSYSHEQGTDPFGTSAPAESSPISEYRPQTVPRLRRAYSTVPSAAPTTTSPLISSSNTNSISLQLQRGSRSRSRRPTYSVSSSKSVSPVIPTPIHGFTPVSPTPSIRRSNHRSPTGSIISLSLTNSNSNNNATIHNKNPTTRVRSSSHSDIFALVEGYVEGGAANETVVYSPGGEVKSVGVLGEEGGEDGGDNDDLEF